ncbi:MAG TPA: hypothetical protein VHT52_22085 [Stellaceae bacterium]|jgi:hypothetical protein|nr:hypothetical protein [Stellaceae bacterium]
MKQRQGAPQISAPGPGNQANSMMQIKSAVDMITNALPGLGADTPVYKAALNALRQLSRHLGQGAPTAGVQQTQLQDMLRKTIQNAMLQRVMQQQAGQQQGGAGQDQSAGPAPPMQAQPPTPSTPLPGA